MRIWSYQGILEIAIFISSYFMNSVSLYLFHILFYILRIIKYDSQSLLIVFLSDILESSWFDKVMWCAKFDYFTTMNQTENNCVLLVEGAVELDFMSSYRLVVKSSHNLLATRLSRWGNKILKWTVVDAFDVCAQVKYLVTRDEEEKI